MILPAYLEQRIGSVLKQEYRLSVDQVTEQQGGWASRAFCIETMDGLYFLKVYEKSRAATAKWTALIDQYLPIVRWLSEGILQGKIVHPIFTVSGACKWEDDDFVYVLFDYLFGDVIGSQTLIEMQGQQLAQTLSVLHSCTDDIPFLTDSIREDFSLPFAEDLEIFCSHLSDCLDTQLKEMLLPYQDKILEMISDEKELAQDRKTFCFDFRLCHTDLHTGNMMATPNGLILVDWEGLKLAPIEADLFLLRGQPYYETFLRYYQTYRKDAEINEKTMTFYQNRRRLEDIWEFVEQLCFDKMNEQQRQENLGYLKQECEAL
jgi:spectinomycin phosphotransferase